MFCRLPRRINFEQPLASEDNPRQVFVGEGSSAPVVEMHLDQRHVPRVARVDVQGLRPCLDPTSYQARPAPPLPRWPKKRYVMPEGDCSTSHAFIHIYIYTHLSSMARYGTSVSGRLRHARVAVQVRFTPLTTVPTSVEIESSDFKRNVAWSTLPGSTISVPEGGVGRSQCKKDEGLGAGLGLT